MERRIMSHRKCSKVGVVVVVSMVGVVVGNVVSKVGDFVVSKVGGVVIT